MPRRQIIWGGKEIDDAVCGLHAASSSSSWPCFPLLPTLLTLPQLSNSSFGLMWLLGHMGAAAVRWWWDGAWDCWARQACPGLAHIWALTRALDGGSGWPRGGGSGIRKHVEIDVLATWCRSLKWLCTISMERCADWPNTFYSPTYCTGICRNGPEFTGIDLNYNN